MACGILAHAEPVVVHRLADGQPCAVDVVRFLSLSLHSRSQLAAENLFLRKQLALNAERRVRVIEPTMRPGSRWSCSPF
jgi:hypothetical protein